MYSVHAHNLTEMAQAVEAALHNPIDSWIPDYMRFDYVQRRMADVVEADWRGVAAEIVEERIRTGEGEVSAVFCLLVDGQDY